jgi:AcrR family transcriptional regulator
MNHFSHGGLAVLERPNQRAVAKQRTREKIVAAARTLFAERGYDGATIRDIAKAAGMSTGAVFASFTDKSDLFTDIAETEQAELYAAMRAVAGGLTGREAILAMLEAAAERHLASLALFQAIMSALWTPGLAEKVRRRLDRRSAATLVLTGVEQELGGETSAASAHLTADMIWDGYLSTLRRVAQGRLTPDLVKARIGEQTRTILAGVWRG